MEALSQWLLGDSIVATATLLVLGLAWTVCCYFLAQLIHQLGYILAGWLLGFRFRYIRVAGITLSVDPDSARLSYSRQVRPGTVMYSPTRTGLIRRARLQVLGKMAIGVLYVLAAWSLYSSTSREAFGGVHYSAAENLLHMALSVVLLFALTQAMTTVLPGPQSDRLALKRLKAESVAFEVYLLIYADTCMRKRPRDWHIESMDGFEKNGHRHSKYGCYCKAVTMLDVGRERESLTQLDELMPSLTPKDAEIQEAALGLVAFLHARSGDMEDARALIDLLESGPPKHKDMLFASKAAFAFSQGDEKSADAFFASAELSLRDQVKHWSLFHDFALELLQRYKEPLQQVPQTDPRPDGTA